MKWKAVLKKIAVAALAAGLCAGMVPGSAYAEETELKAVYNGFFNGIGWGVQREDNTLCMAPAGRYMTAMKASVINQPEGMSGTIAYQANVSGSGWVDWVENFGDLGVTDADTPMEAVRVKLTGDLEKNYDVYYSVFQAGVWTEWVKNNEAMAGVEGQGYWVEGIKISIVAKGGEVPPDQPAVPAVDPTRPMVALTFDDGPNPSVTNRILNSLESYGGRGTFFMVGNRVPGSAEVVSRMAALNCEVANHTLDHKYLTNMNDRGIRANVGQANANVFNACGVTPVLMRPTGGYYNASSLATLGSMGMPAIMWSIDTRDWKHRNPQKTIETVLNQVRDGDIILMHDIYATTADAAEIIIPELTARGYQLVTVSEMANARGGMAPGHVYSQFHP